MLDAQPVSVCAVDSLGGSPDHGGGFEKRLEGRADPARPKAERARGAEGVHVTLVAVVGPSETAQPSPCKARALDRTGSLKKEKKLPTSVRSEKKRKGLKP